MKGVHEMDIILKILCDIRPESDFKESVNFIEDALLDSFDIVSLVATLDGTFAISIEGVDILPENFNSIEAIRELLEKYGVTT